jgi:hypothetical protein
MTTDNINIILFLKSNGYTLIEIIKYLRDNDTYITNDEVKQAYNTK